MIVVANLFYDMLVHFFIFLVIFAYIRYAMRTSIITASLFATILITVINHVFFPKLNLRKLLEN
jgi:hypothetical protein